MSDNSGGDLHIDRETVLVEIPRGDDVLRVTRTEATTGNGKQVWWISVRIFWKQGEVWRPGKAGITIRARELAGVVAALSKSAPAAEPKREPLPHEEYDRMAGRPVR